MTSEFTPITSELLKEICDSAFDETEFATFLGGPDVGAAFTQLKFDHLLFTGSVNIGKHVMRAASENLVPLTLELGGKSPVIVSDSSNIDITARRVMFNKTLNAGQICLAPDYVYVHETEKDNFVEACKDQVNEFYSDLKYNLSHLKEKYPSVPVHIIGNKVDLVDSAKIIEALKEQSLC